MKTANDLWGALGELPEEEAIHVLTKLFDAYERQALKNPQDQEVLRFFQNLDTAIEQTTSCNLNRR